MTDTSAYRCKPALEQRVLSQQLRLVSELTVPPLLGTVFLGVLLALLAAPDHGPRRAWTWYAVLLLVTLVRWQVAQRYSKLPAEHLHDVRTWRNAMLALAALAGAVWSLSGTLLLPTAPEHRMLVAVLFVGATAAGIGSQSPVPYAYAALIIPFLLPFAVHLLFIGGAFVFLGAGFLVYIPVMLAIARRQTHSFEQQIRLGFQNELLIEELRDARDRAEQVNAELHQQMQEQQRSTQRIHSLNRRLKAQAEELQAANRDLESFSYSVSHDLRSPLRAIDGFSQLLEERAVLLGDDEATHHLTRIRSNIARMSSLIDDLLAFARCGQRPLDMADLDMTVLASETAQTVRAAHPDARTVEFVIEPLPDARGDPTLIRQVWFNLIDNAVKYSSRVPRARVTISGREESDRVLFEVTDNGVGFDPAFQEMLFDAFQRLHGAEYPGSGVGLAIVQRIVARHGGTVWARSVETRGSTFGFSLSLRDLTASPPN